ncbi:hypothetical protein DWW90_14970 [Parabacteroides sp. AF17-28]|nr:hypothetical protein DWW90_14970 [Parabacteroides sp. AF17-28]
MGRRPFYFQIIDSPGVSFITLSAFPSFGNQIARFSERAAYLVFPIVRKGSLNREKSQSKIDQNFGRNRKTSEMGVIVIFIRFAGVQNLPEVNQTDFIGAVREPPH